MKKKEHHCQRAALRVICCLLKVKRVCPTTQQNHCDPGPFFSIYGFFLVCFYLLKAAAGNVSGIRLNCQKFEQENKMSSYIYIYICFIPGYYYDNTPVCG